MIFLSQASFHLQEAQDGLGELGELVTCRYNVAEKKDGRLRRGWNVLLTARQTHTTPELAFLLSATSTPWGDCISRVQAAIATLVVCSTEEDAWRNVLEFSGAVR